MSTPSRGGPDDPHDDDQGRPGAEPTGGYPGYPAYPPGPGDAGGHPPDAARGYGGYDEAGGFTQPGAFGQEPGPSPGYGGYGGYPQPYGQPGYGMPPGATEPGTGEIDVLRAVGWGFQIAFKNWKVWVLAALALLALAAVGFAVYMTWVMGQISAVEAGEAVAGVGTGGIAITAVAMIVSLLVWLGLIRGALHQIDDPQMGWRHFVRDVNAIPVILQQLLVGVVLTVLMLLPMAPLFWSINSLAQRSLETLSDEEVLGAIVVPLIGGVLLTLLLAVLLAPLTMFMAYYLVERREGFFGSIREGVKAGGRNYGRLVLYQVVLALLSGVLSSATAGLAGVLLTPALILINAHMYRQAAGGQVPVQV